MAYINLSSLSDVDFRDGVQIFIYPVGEQNPKYVSLGHFWDYASAVKYVEMARRGVDCLDRGYELGGAIKVTSPLEKFIESHNGTLSLEAQKAFEAGYEAGKNE